MLAITLSSSSLSKNLKIKKYRTVILSVVVYRCETWSLKLRDVCRLKLSENRVLRRIFGPKRGKVSGEWRKLHNEELNDLYSSLHIVRVIKLRRIRWAGHVECIGERCIEGFWWGNLRGRDHLEDPAIDGKNIKMYLKEMGCGGMDWIEMAQDKDRWRALLNAIMNLRVP
jgi:hypothetical protein